MEEDYLKEQAEAMLAQLGYHLTAEEMGAPWVNIPLKKENSCSVDELPTIVDFPRTSPNSQKKVFKNIINNI